VVERPILFSGPMVRAILDGRKTQTRRVVKLRDPSGTYAVHDEDGFPLSMDDGGNWRGDRPPYGFPGDRLWVRESFWQAVRSTQGPCGEYSSYWGDTIEYAEQRSKPGWHNDNQYGKGWMARRPSIYMPRSASRITLEVVSVRVERLNDISEEDAIAEGLETDDGREFRSAPGSPWRIEAVDAFEDLWDSINEKKHPWSSNPWVWVVEFKRLEATRA